MGKNRLACFGLFAILLTNLNVHKSPAQKAKLNHFGNTQGL